MSYNLTYKECVHIYGKKTNTFPFHYNPSKMFLGFFQETFMSWRTVSFYLCINTLIKTLFVGKIIKQGITSFFMQIRTVQKKEKSRFSILVLS